MPEIIFPILLILFFCRNKPRLKKEKKKKKASSTFSSIDNNIPMETMEHGGVPRSLIKASAALESTGVP